MEIYHLSFLAAGAASGYYYASQPFGFWQWSSSSTSELRLQLRGTLVVTILRLGFWRWVMEMEKGTHAWCARRASGNYCEGTSSFSNGDGEASASAAGDVTDSSCNYAAWLASAMENAEGSLTPAATHVVTGPCLLSSDAGEGRQWSQWREPLFPKRCRVSFEGRSWL